MTLKSQIERFSINETNFNSVITGSSGATVDLGGGAGTVKTLASAIDTIQIGNNRGAWTTATAYAINDIVLESGAYYRCPVAHTSGVFATDLASGKWRLNQGGDTTILTHRGRLVEDVITARFATVAAMIADVNLVVGDVVETFANQNGAVITQKWEIVAAATGTPDGGAYIDLTGSGLQAKQVMPSRTITPQHYGAAGNGIVNDTAAIQNAVTARKAVFFPRGTYRTESPIYLDGGTVLLGEGSSNTKIIKYTTTIGTGSNTARSGAVTDSYAKDAVFIIRHADNGYAYRVCIKHLWIAGDGWNVSYGIYAPRLSHCIFEDVEIFQCRYGFVTHDAWMCAFTRVTSNPNTAHGVGGQTYGFAGLTYAFYWQDDGSGAATGTTCSFNDCWGRDCDYGWHIFGLKYSSMNSCGSDNISRSSYNFNLTDMTLNGCGSENVLAATSMLVLSFSKIVLNGFHSFLVEGGSGSTSMIFVDGGDVTFNSCVFENFSTPNSALNWTIQSGARITSNNSTFPTNGNTFVSYGGGSKAMFHDANGLVLKDAENSGASRYVKGRINDNTVLQKASKSILSAGTTICTITDTSAGGGASYYCAIKLTLGWFDTAFPTGVGICEVEAVTYRDGANYRQTINTSVNVGQGNGFTTNPTFTITRSGDVWSVVMTPAHGDCTAVNIIATTVTSSQMSVALA